MRRGVCLRLGSKMIRHQLFCIDGDMALLDKLLNEAGQFGTRDGEPQLRSDMSRERSLLFRAAGSLPQLV